MRRLRAGIAQLNMTVGDFAGNRRKILESIEASRSKGVDLLTFPELAVCGYPPEDLLFKPSFIQENRESLEKIIEATPNITVIVGFVDADKDIYNAAAVIHDRKLAGVYHKMFLPNYGVFDEERYFRKGTACPVFELGGVKFGVNICEDIWYETGPAPVQAYHGAEVIVNISASPYNYGRGDVRDKMISARASDNLAVFIYNNLVGGQDELVFDGNSLIMNETGRLIARGKQFEEDLVIADIDVEAVFRTRLRESRGRKEQHLLSEQGLHVETIIVSDTTFSQDKPSITVTAPEVLTDKAEVYQALVLGTRDYIRKNGFKKVALGLSGGIDSSLVASIVTDALGSDNVIGVAMPSRYSSEGSVTDAELLAKNLGIRFLVIPIEKAFTAFLETLEGAFEGREPDVTEENLQARIRGTILMALSNKFGWMVVTAGNKSETATGYATLYGADTTGGLAVIKDVPKTLVYELCRYRNGCADCAVIPEACLVKPPSAELRPDQKDQDSLPPYEVLDPILKAYVEDDKSIEQIIALGFDEQTVRKTVRLVYSNEYKRRQSPPGIKISPRAFGRDRRLPITNHFKG